MSITDPRMMVLLLIIPPVVVRVRLDRGQSRPSEANKRIGGALVRAVFLKAASFETPRFNVDSLLPTKRIASGQKWTFVTRSSSPFGVPWVQILVKGA